jgi:protein-S-isoprenylcysteine O-methyltransferase Ste14
MTDHTFRVALVWSFLVILPVAMYYRIRSQMTGETLDRRQEGLFILATLRPVGLMFALGLIAFMIDPSWMAWSSVPLPTSVRIAGVAVLVLAGGLSLWTLRTLGPNLTDTVVTRKRHALVTTGPYRWVRHPFYDFVALLTVASALMAANWFLLLTGGLLFALMAVRSKIEEQKLLERFGETYRSYRHRTGRFVPKP